jgi:diacylglycerol kinase family enzyme
VQACAVLASGIEKAVDLGVVSSASGDVAFLGIASVGFDSDVQERVLTSRLPLGQLVYLYGTVATVATWKHADFSCTVDAKPLRVHGWSVAVANSGIYGGGMRLAPEASLHDGELDVVTSAESGKLTFLRGLPKVFKGTHVKEPTISLCRARVVELAADRPFRVFADGDPVGTLPCTVTVRPGAVRVLLPA